MMSMLNPSQFQSLDEIETFVHAADVFTLEQNLPRQEKARWLRGRLLHFRYDRLTRKQQGLLRQFFRAITGYSDAQLSRHIGRDQGGDPPLSSLTRPVLSCLQPPVV